MSTATVFKDRPHAISERDENTIITEYWLNFMSVRRKDENPSSFPNRALADEPGDVHIGLYPGIQKLL